MGILRVGDLEGHPRLNNLSNTQTVAPLSSTVTEVRQIVRLVLSIVFLQGGDDPCEDRIRTGE